jgi:SSS family solute:Na+ symporter
MVMIGGLLIAVPLVLSHVGGVAAISAAPGVPATFWDPWYSIGGLSGWTMLILLTPGFIISPGLVQKTYGAESARAVRVGVAAAGIIQLLFSFLPVLLGMAARVSHPGIESTNDVLPTVLANDLPVYLGALALAAVFSAEVSTCDAILFMLSTSSSKDLYQRFVNPEASAEQVLKVARLAALAGGVAGMFLAIQLQTIVDALRIFYSLMGTTLFVPVAGALLFPRAGAREAMTGIVVGVGSLLAVYFGTDRTGWQDPALWGLIGSAIAFAASLATSKVPKVPSVP